MSTLRPMAMAALGVMLLALMLVACSGDAGPEATPLEGPTATGSSAAEDTPTPDARTQGSAELTVEEYAEAMEENAAAREQEFESAAEGVMFGALFSADTVERIGSLEASESWSDGDVGFASDFAETMLQATTGLYDTFLGITRDSIDEMSRLAPPEHLSDLHDDYIATSREILQLTQGLVEGVQDADTSIGNREELANFMEVVNSLESGPSNPDLMERADAACLALESQLESELERDVSICGN